MIRIAVTAAAVCGLAFASVSGAVAAGTAPAHAQGDAYTALGALYFKAGALVAADRGKCARMVPDLTAYLRAHPEAKTLSAATAALQTLQHGQDEAKFKPTYRAVSAKVANASAACKKTAAVSAALVVFKPLYYPNIVVLP